MYPNDCLKRFLENEKQFWNHIYEIWTSLQTSEESRLKVEDLFTKFLNLILLTDLLISIGSEKNIFLSSLLLLLLYLFSKSFLRQSQLRFLAMLSHKIRNCADSIKREKLKHAFAVWIGHAHPKLIKCKRGCFLWRKPYSITCWFSKLVPNFCGYYRNSYT